MTHFEKKGMSSLILDLVTEANEEDFRDEFCIKKNTKIIEQMMRLIKLQMNYLNQILILAK